MGEKGPGLPGSASPPSSRSRFVRTVVDEPLVMLVSTRPSSAVLAGQKGNPAPSESRLGVVWGVTANEYGRGGVLRVTGAGGTELGR